MKTALSVVFFVSICASLTGQIAIDYADVPMTAGLSWRTYYSDQVNVNVGNQGGPQTWNFTSAVSSDFDYHELIVPSTAPAFTRFPSSNKVEFIQDEQGGSDSMFIYFEIIPAHFRVLGWEIIDGGQHVVWPIEQFQFNFALNYLDSASFHDFDTIFDSGPLTTTIDVSSRAVVDAWGTLIIPAGSYSTLRVRQMLRQITRTYFNSVPIITDTTCYILYSWFAENMPELLDVTSPDGDTNLYFTLADNVEMFSDFTGVDENPVAELISSCSIVCDASGFYILTFENLDNASVELIDVLGRKVLDNNISGTGNYRIVTERSGVFFVNVKNQNINFTGKVIYF